MQLLTRLSQVQQLCSCCLLALMRWCAQDLAGGFMSGKLMLKLDAVRFMLANHTQVRRPVCGDALGL